MQYNLSRPQISALLTNLEIEPAAIASFPLALFPLTTNLIPLEPFIPRPFGPLAEIDPLEDHLI
jgi:hypothetical protein